MVGRLKFDTARLPGVGRLPVRVCGWARLMFLGPVECLVGANELLPGEAGLGTALYCGTGATSEWEAEVLEEMRDSLFRWALAPTVRFPIRL